MDPPYRGFAAAVWVVFSFRLGCGNEGCASALAWRLISPLRGVANDDLSSIRGAA